MRSPKRRIVDPAARAMASRAQFRQLGSAADFWLEALDEQVRIDPESGRQVFKDNQWVRWIKRPFDLPQGGQLICRVYYRYTDSEVQWLKFTWGTVNVCLQGK